jgi:hypothetical protein
MAREPARSFEDLIVWQKAHSMVLGLATDLGYGSNPELIEEAAEVGRLLGAYARTLLAPSSSLSS